MKKLSFILMTGLLLHLSVTGTQGPVVKNPDQPQKGKWDFKPEKAWVMDAVGDDLLGSLTYMKVDPKGNLYIYESKHKRFYVLDPRGKLLTSFGRRGEGPGEFKMVRGLFIRNDRLIIPDFSKIYIFSLKGEPIKTIRPRKSIFHSLFIDENRLIKQSYLAHYKRDDPNYIELYNLETKKTRKLVELKLDERRLKYDAGKFRLSLSAGATMPTLIMKSDSQSLYYGNNDRYQINKIDFNGKPLLSFSIEGRKKKRISRDTKLKYCRNRLTGIANIPEDAPKTMIKQIPDETPYFDGIVLDKKGLIYVCLIDIEKQNQKAMDIFSSEGKYMYHSVIDLSSDFEGIIMMTFSWAGSELYVFAQDQDGEGHLVKYKINLPN